MQDEDQDEDRLIYPLPGVILTLPGGCAIPFFFACTWQRLPCKSLRQIGLPDDSGLERCRRRCSAGSATKTRTRGVV